MAQKSNNNKKRTAYSEQDVLKGAASRYRKRRLNSSNIAVILCAVLFISVIAASFWQILKNSDKLFDNLHFGKDTEAGQAIQPEADETEPPIGGAAASEFEFITVPSADVVKGDLILVNYENSYTFPETEDHLVNIYENKTDNYGVAYNTYVLDSDVLEQFNAFMDELNEVTGDHCILVNSTYRSFEEQQSIYDSYVQSNGEEYAKAYVADPGCSEHHTGLSLDLTVRYDDGTYVLMKNYENLPTLNTVCVKYGFIQRYPDSKFNFTRISTEPWHYRYVGVPHAYIICKKNFCLEEYIIFMKEYTTDGQMLLINENGEVLPFEGGQIPERGYLLYYVPADEGGDTEIPVPTAAESYTVSGDNGDGFIVAAKLGDVNFPEVAFTTPD